MPDQRENWFGKKFKVLKSSFYAFIPGILCLIIALLPKDDISGLVLIGVLLCLPLMLCIQLIPLYHWKDRYIGHNSNFWGALIVLDTSSLFKLFYWIRHVLADWKNRGRYVE